MHDCDCVIIGQIFFILGAKCICLFTTGVLLSSLRMESTIYCNTQVLIYQTTRC